MKVTYKHGYACFYLLLLFVIYNENYVQCERRQLHLIPSRRGEENSKNKVLLSLPDENGGRDYTGVNFKLTSQGVLVPDIDSARKKSLFIDLVKEAEKNADTESSARSLSDNQKLVASESNTETKGDVESSDNINKATDQIRKAKEIELKNEALAKIEELARQNLEDIARLKNDAMKEKDQAKKNDTEAEQKKNEKKLKEEQNIEKVTSGDNNDNKEKEKETSQEKDENTVVVETVPDKTDDKNIQHSPIEDVLAEASNSSKVHKAPTPSEGKADGSPPKPVDVKNDDKSFKQNLEEKLLEDEKASPQLLKDKESPEQPKEIVKQDTPDEGEKAEVEAKQPEEKDQEKKKKKKVKILILDDDESIPDHIGDADISHVKEVRPLLHVMAPNQMNVEEQIGGAHPSQSALIQQHIPSPVRFPENVKPCPSMSMVGFQQHVVDHGPSQHIIKCPEGFLGSRLPSIETSKNFNGIPFTSNPQYDEEGGYKSGNDFQNFNRYYPKLKHRHKLPRNPFEDKALQPPEIHYHFHLTKDNFNSLKDKVDSDIDSDDMPATKDQLMPEPQEEEKDDSQKTSMIRPYIPVFKQVGDNIASHFRKQMSTTNLEPTDIRIESNDLQKLQSLVGDAAGRYLAKRTYKKNNSKNIKKKGKRFKKRSLKSKFHRHVKT